VGNGNEANSPEIVAPGMDVLTTVPNQTYDFMTGSSFATPHVAGVVALLLQLYPNWQTVDVKRFLGGDLNLLTANLLNATTASAQQDK
jgi:subtilisin family serine protease